jgi:hypothetical protein
MQDTDTRLPVWMWGSTSILAACTDALQICAGIALWGKRPGCVRLARIALTISTVWSVIGFWLVPYEISFAYRQPNPSYSVLNPNQSRYLYQDFASMRSWTSYFLLALQIVWCVVWLLYLRRSRRVRLTYYGETGVKK